MPFVNSTSNSSQNNSQTHPTLETYRGQIQNQIPVATGIFSALAAFYFLFLAIQTQSWQSVAVAGVFTISWLFSAFASTGVMFKDQETRRTVSSAVFQFAIFSLSTLISGMAVPGAVIILLYSLIVSCSSENEHRNEFGINIGLGFASLTAIIGTVAPLKQLAAPQLYTVVPTVLGILVMIYLTLVMMQFVVATLRLKLVSSTLSVVLLPLILLAFISSQFTQNALQSQINQSLNLAAKQTADKLDEFLERTGSTVAYQAKLPVFSNFLRMAPEERDRSLVMEQLVLTLNSLQLDHAAYVSSIAIISLQGTNVYDTSPLKVGTSELSADYFKIPSNTGQSYISPVLFSPETDAGYIYFSAPIRNPEQELVGVLRVKYDALVLQSIIEEDSSPTGSRSHPILFDENQSRIADSMTPSLLYKTVTDLTTDEYSLLRNADRLPNRPLYRLSTNLDDLAKALRQYQKSAFFTLEIHPSSSEDHVEIGAIRILKDKPWTLIYVQEEAGFTKIISEQNRISTLVAALIASVVSLFGAFMARNFSNPIQSLTETATKVTAGDMTARAIVKTNDEIGTLATAFNSMTSQLSTLVNELEDRVNKRTQELATQNQALVYRSRQLQTVADVARGIAGAQELETLLTQITTLISERFNFYHVGVFLVDEKGEFAVLRAANSEGGKRMLARQHMLQVGKVGIVGYVTSSGEPRIATDVGEDAVFFNNPDLPKTRSEMALPLRVSGRIIGALDVQSTESSAFSNEDVALFNTLSDQVAIAIENNRLFSETARALEEAQNTHRQYLRQEWNRELTDRQHLSFVFTPQGVIEQDRIDDAMEIIRGKDLPVTLTTQGEDLTTAAVPIQIRGETVGVIRAQDNGKAREWTEEELNMLKSVADQVAVALENARLFEQTVRRAEREKKALEITNKIRSTNDPKQMLQIAVEELQNALKASRAQIILEPTEKGTEPSNGNGSGNHKDHGNAG
ncbi:protein containg FOG: GAF domain [Longilinea arvoryzae]|uniref:Protein containg FOG: GAF domain n=1 Tax=Longilinea arvoryzae TaxID=360412 RepID=A0A0S7BB04_9CHLR|nr:GAF domain-containing protein [Longilinea arvoryzae]GAP14908.1 protein containg FOG: GAF domain [Longilinea arvoryzae]